MPLRKCILKLVIVFLKLGDFLRDLIFKFGFCFDLFVRVKKQVGFVDVIEQTHQPEVFVMGDGVVLMGVALGAARGQPHPDRTGGGDPVDRGIKTKFERINAPLLIELGIAVKTGGNPLVIEASGSMSPASCSMEN